MNEEDRILKIIQDMKKDYECDNHIVRKYDRCTFTACLVLDEIEEKYNEFLIDD